MKYFFFTIVIFITACAGGNGDSSIDGLSKINIAGSDASISVGGALTTNDYTKGIIRDGKKDGVWIEYYSDSRIKSISNYVDDKLNLIKIEFNTRGQITTRAEYLNDKYDGVVAEYKNGRILKERSYSQGILDGPYKEYSDRSKLIKEGAFKNGKQHGKLIFYNDEGQKTLEYEYKDGEKISGGIVENAANEE